MRVLAGVGSGFLVAVLWFDLMFDVQARGRSTEASAVARSVLRDHRVGFAAVAMSALVQLLPS